ncbi:MAG TPA: oligosaccharide flippase family protein [Ferruginibacter sp.]|nr:oligosaccharide flippase family protein [Ferruginibacter sp.]
MLQKILTKLRNKHFLSLAGNGSMAVLSIVTYSLLYRMLTEEEMGNWVFFQFAFILIDTFRTGFLQTAIVKFFAGADAERATEVVGSVWFVALWITGVFLFADLAGIALLRHIHDTSLVLFIQWSGAAFLLSLPMNISMWVVQAEQRFDKILYIRMISQGSFIILILFFYFFHARHLSLQEVFVSYIISSLLTAIVCLFSGWTAVKHFVKRSKACIMEVFHFGKYSVGTVVSSSLLRSSDTFIINFMLGPAPLAIYNLPQRLLEVIEIPMRSFLATAMPEMSVAANQNDMVSVANIMKKYAGLLTMALIPIAIVGMLSADIVVGLIGGGKYVHTEAANVFRIFLLFSILNPLDRFMGITLDIIHKPHLNFIKVLIMLFATIITDIIGIYIFHNVYGPAWASIFTFFVGIVYGYLVLRKYLKFGIPEIIKFGYTESIHIIQGFILKLKVVKA